MSTKLLSLSSVALLLGGTAMADVPKVAVDIAPVHSLVSRVMDGVGTPDLVIQPGASPHEYSLRPSEAAALQEADLVFWIGEDLTPWMEGAIETLADDANVTSLLEADGTVLLDFRESALFEAHAHGDDDHEGHEDHADHDGHDDHEDHAGHDDHEEHAEGEEHAHDEDHEGHDHEEHADHDEHAHDDHEEHAEHEEHGHDDHDDHAGHDHGAHDPHAWLSPENASTWLNLIAAQLSAADPENAGTYFANASAARVEMDALATEVNAILDPARGGNFVVFHDAYQYFETAFDFPASGAISLGDATDPSPARITEIQDRIADEAVSCVLAEPQFNPNLVTTVLDGTEAQTGVLDPLGAELAPGAALYPQLIRNLATTLVGCL